jgi:hypothetical protein
MPSFAKVRITYSPGKFEHPKEEREKHKKQGDPVPIEDPEDPE